MSTLDELIYQVKEKKQVTKEFINDMSSNQGCLMANLYNESYKEYEELLEVLEAYKDGRVLVLPVKKDDDVWAIGRGEIFKCKVESVSSKCRILSYARYYYASDDEWSSEFGADITKDDFGKTVFYTEYEASKALRKEDG
jgi:hypothetical protein